MNQQNAAALLAQGPTIAQCSAMTFENLLPYLQDENTINRAWACLEPLTAMQYTNPRVFLSGYMIVCFPARVFETNDNAQEAELSQSARNFITQLERIAGNVKNGVAVDDQVFETFRTAMDDFHDKFTIWKAADVIRILRRIRSGVIRLYHVKALLTDDSLTAIRATASIARLKQKYLAIGGQQQMNALETFLVATFPGLV